MTTTSTSPFLTASWRDLCLVTWAVPDALLAPHVPAGLELDRWEGSALVSLVAFRFEDTRVFGLPWPGFTAFPELNLRVYVRRGDCRGVCFVREYVPSPVVAWIARTVYNEPYRAAPYRAEATRHVLNVGGRKHSIEWDTRGAAEVPGPDTLAHFLKEHDTGFGRARSGETRAYRVEHPTWRAWLDVESELDVDFGLLYGNEWSVLGTMAPRSVIVAEGSPVQVFGAASLDLLCE
ncbi:MAG: DUF2071 domain-containing protein [Polyangiales bacterium]|nr:DUF2071 domain-containing protein [Myxococcales bacterium]